MSSAHTLTLDFDWDLHVDPAGNLPVSFEGYSIAQNVANAFRLFTNDAWYFPEKGIAHFLIELRKGPKLNVLKTRLKRAALAVEGVADCEISLLHFEDRDLSGLATITLTNGDKFDVAI